MNDDLDLLFQWMLILSLMNDEKDELMSEEKETYLNLIEK
jgi:hypothetical protein